MAQIRAEGGKVDPDRVSAEPSDDDIARWEAEDGFRPGEFEGPKSWPDPALLRKRLGMTQVQVAELLRVPVASWRNWEQGRVLPDPAARALLNLLNRKPEAVCRGLGARSAAA